MKIKIKYFEGAEKLDVYEQGDWIDLKVAADVQIAPGGFLLIPLGVAMQLPKSYEAIVVPRSSTYKKYGLIQANHMGVIDNSYSGDNDQWPRSGVFRPQRSDGKSRRVFPRRQARDGVG